MSEKDFMNAMSGAASLEHMSDAEKAKRMASLKQLLADEMKRRKMKPEAPKKK